MSEQDPEWRSIAGLAADIERGALSPVELTQACLDRIDDLDRRVHSFITVDRDRALASAAVAEREIRSGAYKGPLHGIPYALKDIICTNGLPTTAGSKILRDHSPNFDATVVERLTAAGAVLLGKVHTYEFACGPNGGHPSFPQARNPWDLARIPGGSSSGSATATAAGLCPVAIGTCTGGSIRMPASLCGVAGLKPTYGRVSRYGTIPLSWSLDHVGPIARTVADCATALRAIAGADARDATTSHISVPDYVADLRGSIRGVRVGVVREMWTDPIDADVRQLTERALSTFAELGAVVREVSLPLAADAVPAVAVIMSSESAQVHSDWLRTRIQDYGPGVAARLLVGAGLTAPDLVLAHRVRRLAVDQFRVAMADVDVLVSPSTPITAPYFDRDTVEVSGARIPWREILSRFTRIYNLTGMPALSVLCGFASNGMPVGIQLAGRPFDESTLLRVGHAYEREAGWTSRLPLFGTSHGPASDGVGGLAT